MTKRWTDADAAKHAARMNADSGKRVIPKSSEPKTKTERPSHVPRRKECRTPQVLFIPGQLPGMNDLIDQASRRNGNWSQYAETKKQWLRNVAVFAERDGLLPTGRVHVLFEWIEQSKRRDPDNISSAGRKLILDGLVECGVLVDDGPKFIAGFEDRFSYSKTDPGVRITLTPVPK